MTVTVLALLDATVDPWRVPFNGTRPIKLRPRLIMDILLPPELAILMNHSVSLVIKATLM